MHFLLWTKGSHQISNFENFKCSGENVPNSSCHFPNYKSVFLQTLHHSSVSCKITSLHFFRSNVIYFAQTEPMKVQILETYECSGQSSPNSCSFETTNQFFFKFCITLQCHET